MRRNYILTLLLGAAALLGTGSCSSELDDIRPKDKISQDALSEDDLNKVVNGIYAKMEDMIFNAWWDGDLMGENYQAGPGGTMNDPLVMDPTTGFVATRWSNAYSALKQVNFLIETYEASSNKENASVKQAGGVGYFFRALIYYNLAARYGNVPILEKRTYDIVSISKEAEVWAFVKSDLARAEALLQSSASSCFYATQNACYALHARVSLFLGEKSDAATYADKVIASNAYSLTATSTDFAKQFLSGTTSPEVIFALANKRTSSYLLFYQYVNDVDASWNYAPSDACYKNLYADTSIKSGDIRKEPTFSTTDARRVIKFPNGGSGQFVAESTKEQTPVVVFRLAEMYLIKAEAQGAASGLSTLNALMQKRYNSVLLPTSMSDTEYQNLILDERQREFYGEGFRWFDLKRTNRLDLFDGLNGRTYLMYWPIPQAQIDLAGTTAYPQNEGYN